MENHIEIFLMFCMNFIIAIEANTFEESCEVVTLPILKSSLEGKYLADHTFGAVYTRDKAFCFIHCMLDKRCCSVNYEEDILLCHLNNETHITEPLSLMSSVDSKQYYPMDGINESIIGRCQNHDCPEGTTCTPQPYGSSQRYLCIYVQFANVQNTSPSDLQQTTTSEACIDGCNNCEDSRSTAIGTIAATPIGCFEAPGSSNPLPTLLVNLRSNIDWTALHLTLEGCAQAAQTAGWQYFGIEYWGECWVSNTFDPSLFTKITGSNCATECYMGLAAADTLFVYESI